MLFVLVEVVDIYNIFNIEVHARTPFVDVRFILKILKYTKSYKIVIRYILLQQILL